MLRIHYSCEISANRATVTSTMEQNKFQSWWKDAEIRMYGVPNAPKGVRIGTRVLDGWHYDSVTHTLTLNITDAAKSWSVEVGF